MLANMNVKTNARRIVFAVTTAAFLLGCGGALASGGDDDDRGKSPEYTHKPFFDDLLLTSYAYGLEMVGQRLRIAKRFTPNINDPLAYQLKRMHGKNFDRFRGTLAERNSALEAELDGALGGVMDAISAGSNATAAIVKAEGLLAQAYDVWSFKVLPRLGQAVASDRDSYQYLAESIRRFPDQETLAGMLREAGFERVTFENLSAGIAAIHRGART